MPRLAVGVGALLLAATVSVMVLSFPGAYAQSTFPVEIPNGAGEGASGAPGYTPDTVTVVIGENNTVVWTNYDTVDNTVTSVSVPPGAAAFDSGMLDPTRGMPWQHVPGGAFSETFTVPGTYQYHCTLHAWMTGTVVVLAASTSSTSSISSSASTSTSSSASTSTANAPEFPASGLAIILFAVIAAVMLATQRLSPSLFAGKQAGTKGGSVPSAAS